MSSAEGATSAAAADLASMTAMTRRVISLVSGFSMAFGLSLVAIEAIVCMCVWYRDLSVPVLTALFLAGFFSFAFGFTVRKVVIQEKKLLPNGLRLSSICSKRTSSEMSAHVTHFRGLLVASGILIAVLGSLTIYGDAMFPEIVAIIDFGLGIMGVFMGMACGFILTGIITIVAAYKPSRCWIVLSLIGNFITMGLAIALEVIVWQNYFYASRGEVLATSPSQLLVIMAKLAPPFAVIFLAGVNIFAMISSFVRIGCKESADMPVLKSEALRPSTKLGLRLSGCGLLVCGLVLVATYMALPATGHFNFYDIYNLQNLPLAASGLCFCTAFAAFIVAHMRRSCSFVKMLVVMLGLATVGVSICGLILTADLYKGKMYVLDNVRRDGIREANGSMQFCACLKTKSGDDSWRSYDRTRTDDKYGCIDINKLCDGVVDMPKSDYKMCPGPQYNNYYDYNDHKVAPDEGYCYAAWRPLYFTQFGFFGLSIILALVVAVLNIGVVKVAATAARNCIETMIREMDGDMTKLEEDKEEVLDGVAEQEQLNG